MSEKEYKNSRNFFHPQKFEKDLEIIFIFESPPASGKYFYNIEGDKNENLYRDTMKAFLGKKFTNKNDGLTEFAKNGFFLIDATYFPVNKKNKKARRDTIYQSLSSLKEDIEDNLSSYSNCKVILVTRHVFDITKGELEKHFPSKIINNEIFVPYNGFGQQKKFREAVKSIFKNNNINKEVYDEHLYY